MTSASTAFNIAICAALLALVSMILPRKVQCSRCHPQFVTNTVYRVSTNDFLRIYVSGTYEDSSMMHEATTVPVDKLEQFIKERSETRRQKALTRFMDLQELLAR